MGTDHTEYLREPCPCGNGELYVDHCLPDHGWSPGAYWWELGIRCKECQEKYGLMNLNNKAVLMEKGDPPTVVRELEGELTQRAFYGPDYKGND